MFLFLIAIKALQLQFVQSSYKAVLHTVVSILQIIVMGWTHIWDLVPRTPALPLYTRQVAAI